ncbi:hypothetical protein CRUP_011914, partial [Coryphaenoides rupestris]
MKKEGEEEEGSDSGEETGEEEQDSEDDGEKEGKRTRRGKPSEKQSAAALCVGVGSFSDPDDLPGLAHFLEHMVFMGSEKYPTENGFDVFLNKHGGSDNASTDCERTVFQWAQFFICPLMIRDAVDREVEAVDSVPVGQAVGLPQEGDAVRQPGQTRTPHGQDPKKKKINVYKELRAFWKRYYSAHYMTLTVQSIEYQLAKPSDSHRKEMLFGSLAKPGHPMGKFGWGNAQSLKQDPKKKKINVYKELRAFWKRYYSAHYMTLTVQSIEKLDTLEDVQPKPDFSHLQDPFDTPAFNKLVKPLHYISWLIGHEGAGSILSLLRK